MPEEQLSSEVSRRLRQIFDEVLPVWDERTRQPAEAEPGSSLDGDIKIYSNVAALAWQGITSAVDHLKALRDLWMTAGSVHAFADATLLRGALLSAATTVYLLDDSPGIARRDRVKRAALASLSDHRDHLWHQTAMTEMTATLGEEATATHQDLIARLREWAARAEQVAREHGATQKELRSGLVATDCVVQAGHVISGHEQPEQQIRLQSGLRAVWQKGSADAHARTWQTMTRRDPGGPPLLRADISELMNGLNAATLVLNEAWRLWDARRVNHLNRQLPVPPDFA